MVRSFSDKKIPKYKLDIIVRNTFRGPSAGFSQGTQIVVLTERQSREAFFRQWGSPEERSSYRSTWPNLEKAPVIILICADEPRYRERYGMGDKGGLPDETMPWWYIDAGMAALLTLLSAVDQGLVAAFTGVKSQDYLRQEFKIPAELDVIGAILLGYQEGAYRPSKSAIRGRRPIGEIVHYNSWDS